MEDVFADRRAKLDACARRREPFPYEFDGAEPIAAIRARYEDLARR